MAHLSSIGAAMFTDLAVAVGTITNGKDQTPVTAATLDGPGFAAVFGTTSNIPEYRRVKNIREFPAVGAQPNIVNVPVYGQKTAQTISGQSDPPSLEITVNYVGTEWALGTSATTFNASQVESVKGNEIANMVGDGLSRPWRFALMLAEVNVSAITPSATLSPYDSHAGGIGTVQNSLYYFMGKLESMLVTPSLTDSTTATLSFSIQSPFYGAFTV